MQGVNCRAWGEFTLVGGSDQRISHLQKKHTYIIINTKDNFITNAN